MMFVNKFMSFLLTIARNYFPEILSGIAFIFLQLVFPILGYLTNLYDNIVLSLLVEVFLTLYQDRKNLQKINNKLDNLKLTEKEFLLKRRHDLLPFEERFFQVKNICISGFSLVSIRSTHYGIIEKKYLDGSEIELTVLNPYNKQLLEMAVNILPAFTNYESLKSEIETTITRFSKLNLEKASNGKIDIYMVDKIPSCGYVIVDPYEPLGKIKAEIYLENVAAGSRPHITLTKKDNGFWYDLFLNSYKKMIQSALLYNP